MTDMTMVERKAWFCPGCQKHHGPHVDTCPEPAQAIPVPGVTTPYIAPAWQPDPNGTPWAPSFPNITCGPGLFEVYRQPGDAWGYNVWVQDFEHPNKD